MDTIRHQFSDWVTGDTTLGVAVAAEMAGEGMYTGPTQCALERRVQRIMRHRSGETWSTDGCKGKARRRKHRCP